VPTRALFASVVHSISTAPAEREHGRKKAEMLWIVTAASVVAAMVTLVFVFLVKRDVRVDELGTVSSRWIADHRADSR
jgi:hypothetical protein